MDPAPDQPDHGQDTPAAPPARKVPPRGVDPLSAAHRRRVLKALMATAKGEGPNAVQAQRALVELSLAAERDAEIADALRRLRADDGEAE